MKNTLLTYILVVGFLACIPVHANSQEAKPNTNSMLHVIFFKYGKDGRISLEEIEGKARICLREKYSDFPQNVELGSLHVECKRNRQVFNFVYGLGDIGGKCWEITLGSDLKIHHIRSGRIRVR